MKDILYIPKIREILISVISINDNGFDIHFRRNSQVIIKRNRKIAAKGYREGRLFYLSVKPKNIITDSIKDTKEDLSISNVTEISIKDDSKIISYKVLNRILLPSKIPR